MSAGTRGGKRSGLKGGGCDFEVLRESDTVAVLEAVAIPGIVYILDRAAIRAAQTRSQPSDHISSSASRPLKTRQTVWGVISDDAN